MKRSVGGLRSDLMVRVKVPGKLASYSIGAAVGCAGVLFYNKAFSAEICGSVYRALGR